MKLSRRSLLKAALGMPAAAWLLNYRAAAAPHAGQVKVTKIKTMGLDNLGDGCLIRIETDAGIVGYGEAGLPSAAARTRIEMMAPQLIGQDPLAIERHFYLMAATQYSFMANIPTVSGIDIALWDLAGKITGYPSIACSADRSGRTSRFTRMEVRRTCLIKRSARPGRTR